MTETLYLIAHKVRGQPAFDVAVQMEMDDEVWWIVSTSGHRAYPYWHCSVNELFAYKNVGDPPADWPDHYWQPGQTSDLVIPENVGHSLLERLGMTMKKEPIGRRI